MTCPLCNDTGEQRYWEARWRDERTENVKLRAENIKVSCHCAALIQAIRDLGAPDEVIAAIAHQQSQTEPK